MKKAALIALIPLLLLAGCARKEEPEPEDTTPPVVVTVTPERPRKEGPSAWDYLSFEPDVHMVYEGSGNEYASFETWVEYVSRDAVQLRVDTGGTVSSVVYTATEDGLVMTASRGEEYGRANLIGQNTTEDILIKEPIAVGTEWRSDGKTRRITGVDVEVTVPLGTYKALEVTTKTAAGTVQDYYAKGVGLIKTVFTPNEDKSAVITSALARRETGAAVTLHLNVYYPREDGSGVVFTDREVSLKTGDTLAQALTELFRTPPAGAAPVMPKKGEILSVGFDLQAGTATVDLGKSFTEGMAGKSAALERLILQSLANTLADAFQTENVALTVEGGAYRTENFYFDPGQNLYVRIDTAQAAEEETE